MRAFNKSNKPKHWVKPKWHRKFSLVTSCSKKIGKAGTFFVFAYTHTIKKYQKQFLKKLKR